MNVTVYPGKLSGEASLPFAKTYVHRLLLASFLAGDMADISCECEDTRVMRDCLTALKKTPADRPALLDVKECGTALRFLVPVCAALGRDVTFEMADPLSKRPMEPLLTLLARRGVTVERTENLLRIRGKLRGGSEAFCLPGNISSQFFSGLLFALALLPEGGAVAYYTPLQSADYVELTLSVLRAFGVRVRGIPDVGWVVERNCSFTGRMRSARSGIIPLPHSFMQPTRWEAM
jgi:5-enolpyruvylshikimate-3-phosphate synthase